MERHNDKFLVRIEKDTALFEIMIAKHAEQSNSPRTSYSKI